MAVFGEFGDTELWAGAEYRRTRSGVLLQRGAETAYLSRRAGLRLEGRLDEARTWHIWRQVFRQGVKG
jgi:hypothetical protein